MNFPKPSISQQVGEVCEKEMIVWGRFFKIVLLTLENKADLQKTNVQYIVRQNEKQQNLL